MSVCVCVRARASVHAAVVVHQCGYVCAHIKCEYPITISYMQKYCIRR